MNVEVNIAAPRHVLMLPSLKCDLLTSVIGDLVQVVFWAVIFEYK